MSNKFIKSYNINIRSISEPIVSCKFRGDEYFERFKTLKISESY